MINKAYKGNLSICPTQWQLTNGSFRCNICSEGINPGGGGGDRSEAWDRETMFSQLAKRSSQNVDSGVRHNKYSVRRSGGSDELRPGH